MHNTEVYYVFKPCHIPCVTPGKVCASHPKIAIPCSHGCDSASYRPELGGGLIEGSAFSPLCGHFIVRVPQSILSHIHKRDYNTIKCAGDLPTRSVPTAHWPVVLTANSPKWGRSPFGSEARREVCSSTVAPTVIRPAFSFDLSCFVHGQRALKLVGGSGSSPSWM